MTVSVLIKHGVCIGSGVWMASRVRVKWLVLLKDRVPVVYQIYE